MTMLTCKLTSKYVYICRIRQIVVNTGYQNHISGLDFRQIVFRR